MPCKTADRQNECFHVKCVYAHKQLQTLAGPNMCEAHTFHQNVCYVLILFTQVFGLIMFTSTAHVFIAISTAVYI